MPSNTPRRGDRWGARVTVAGRQIWLGTFETEALALEAVSAARMGGGRSGTVGEWFDAWPAIAGARRDRSVLTISRTLALAAPFREAFGGLKLATLTRERCAIWALGHPSHLRYARTVLSDAVWAGVLAANPLEGVRAPAAPTGTRRPLSEDELGRLVECSRSPMRELVLICAWSGLRLSEALALEARDLDGDTLHVRHGKGGKEGWSVLLEPGLSAFRERAPDFGRLFPPGMDRRTVNRAWVLTRVDAGVEWARFHDLRHFHATMLLGRGVSRADVAMQLRHAGLRDVDRYLHAGAVAPAALDRVRAVA